MHTESAGTVGDLYVTLADEVLHAGVGTFPLTIANLLAEDPGVMWGGHP